jgi:RNA polymerase sigma factor (sigma-70 family)
MTQRNRAHLTPLGLIFHPAGPGTLTDGQLLERFAGPGGSHAESAFAALVERHGAMVLRAARSILRDHHEAEDVAQATFLILARRARSLWVRDSLGPWLHRVATRAALRARRSAERRAAAERRAVRPAFAPGEPPAEGAEAWVHRELDRLPEPYRASLVLCDLQGRSHEEAARHLGCAVGTVKSRLSRGRRKLRGLLVRKGLAPTVAAAWATGERARAAVPEGMAADTSLAAARLLAGEPLVAVAPAGVVPHVERGLKMLRLGQLGRPLAAVMVATVALSVAGWWARGSTQPEGRTEVRIAAASPEPQDEPTTTEGIVRDADGRPVAGATVVASYRVRGETSTRTVAQTDDQGRFNLSDARRPDFVLAHAPGHAPAEWTPPRVPEDPAPNGLLEITLPEPEPFVGEVKGPGGAPIAGAEVRISGMVGSGANVIHRSDLVGDAVRDTPLEALFVAKTDDAGRFRFPAVPKPARVALEVRSEGMGPYRSWMVAGRHGDELYLSGTEAAPAKIELSSGARVVGRVVTRLPGVSLDGIEILLQGENASTGQSARTSTDAQGRFEFAGLAAGRVNIFPGQPEDSPWTARAVVGLELRPGETAQAEPELIRGAVVEGRVVRARWLGFLLELPPPAERGRFLYRGDNAGPNGEMVWNRYDITDRPVKGVHVGAYGTARPRSGAAIINVQTDAEGHYRLRLPPGSHDLYIAESRYDDSGGKTIQVAEDSEAVEGPTFWVVETSQNPPSAFDAPRLRRPEVAPGPPGRSGGKGSEGKDRASPGG